MGIGNQAGAVQVEFSLCIHVFLVHCNAENFRQKQIVAPQRNHLFDLTFQIHRTLRDARCLDMLRFGWRQMHPFKDVMTDGCNMGVKSLLHHYH